MHRAAVFVSDEVMNSSKRAPNKDHIETREQAKERFSRQPPALTSLLADETTLDSLQAKLDSQVNEIASLRKEAELFFSVMTDNEINEVFSHSATEQSVPSSYESSSTGITTESEKTRAYRKVSHARHRVLVTER
jgi:hypothetical protein